MERRPTTRSSTLSLRPAREAMRESSKRTYVIDQLKKRLGLSPRYRKGIFSNPISLERKHFDKLRDGHYYCAQKDDGKHYYMILDRYRDGTPFSALVDRKMNVYEVMVYAAEEFFRGSVFEGEMVWEHIDGNHRETQSILFFSAWSYCGVGKTRDKFFERYQLCKMAFCDSPAINTLPSTEFTSEAKRLAQDGKIMCKANAYGLFFRTKTIKESRFVGTVWRAMKNLSHDSDGLIFTPNDAPFVAGTNWDLFKFKTDHTLDFVVYGVFSKTPPTEDMWPNAPTKDMWPSAEPSSSSAAAEGKIEKVVVVGEKRKRSAADDDDDKNNHNGATASAKEEEFDDTHTAVSQPSLLGPKAASRWYWRIYYGKNDNPHALEPFEYNGKPHRLRICVNKELQNTQAKLEQRNKNRIRFVGEFSVSFSDDHDEEDGSRLLDCNLTRLRGDKRDPNNLFTMQRTLVNIEENIQIPELVQLLER